MEYLDHLPQLDLGTPDSELESAENRKDPLTTVMRDRHYPLANRAKRPPQLRIFRRATSNRGEYVAVK